MAAVMEEIMEATTATTTTKFMTTIVPDVIYSYSDGHKDYDDDYHVDCRRKYWHPRCRGYNDY
jgi:hypothetical protein